MVNNTGFSTCSRVTHTGRYYPTSIKVTNRESIRQGWMTERHDPSWPVSDKTTCHNLPSNSSNYQMTTRFQGKDRKTRCCCCCSCWCRALIRGEWLLQRTCDFLSTNLLSFAVTSGSSFPCCLLSTLAAVSYLLSSNSPQLDNKFLSTADCCSLKAKTGAREDIVIS